ncbi:phospholipase D alpha 1-like [Musa acuminata AAA Group]|uniref:phospholipase D alpha 1-like n=1 Tax=Musa acuminata AAA Group TaxID=214697 RepID=UPI0031E3F83F
MAGVVRITASSVFHGIFGALNNKHQGAEAPALLHGVLEVTIYEANHLHNVTEGLVLQAAESVQEAFKDKLAHTRLFAAVEIGAATVVRTRMAEFQPDNPKWNQSFRVYCAYTSPYVEISVRNQLQVALAMAVGRAKIPASQLLTGEPVEGWFDLFHDDGLKMHNAQVHAVLKFTPVTGDPCWDVGISSSFSGLSNAFFPLRTGCEVTLYQDAHKSNQFRPAIQLAGGKDYQPARLWEDIYNAMVEAKHFIYVTGWSVNVHIELVRDPERMIPGAEAVTLGELLKRKAEEGVAVLVMPWNDRTSLPILEDVGMQFVDLMKTHDEETFKFFKGTKVKCFRCSRNADPSLAFVQNGELKLMFSHHQKTVSLDAPSGDGASKVVSFVGGIDLSDGRYDDENHTLFGNLSTTYLNDFLQGNFKNADLHHGGPREPWHDVHSKVEGQAAWDVLTNFEQRWIKQAPKELTNYLVNVRERPQIFPIPSDSATAESWNVQVFRSIDDASAIGFPPDPSQADKMGLVTGQNVTFEQSIHSSYVEGIRRAKRFIYIENQYFFGSCASWGEHQNCGCSNLIPIEIALKIASKIRNGERFAVYIVTPMWPEGIPEGNTVQAILHWNRLTMEMMYSIVAKAIEDKGLVGKVNPGDYLNFFCLGNREEKKPGEYVPPKSPKHGTDYWRAQTNRRFLIYVHSKLMIVDDEYVIVGSANLNQRSLAGDRDSEIAHGSYQPAHLNGSDGRARGEVHGFRMSLWYEHFMSYCADTSIFLDPENLECVRTVRRFAEELWSKYVGEEVVDLRGHLLPFPVLVSEAGTLSDLPKDGRFPDTNASVKGKRWVPTPPLTSSSRVTDLLTT